MASLCQCSACLQAEAGSGSADATTGVKWGAGPPGTGGGTVSWSVATTNFPDAIQFDLMLTFLPEGFEAELARAFAAWEAVTDIQFVQVADAADVGIRLGGEDMDGPFGTVGRAYWAYDGTEIVAAEVSFDAAEAWTLGSDGISVFSVAVHEIGHAIGLAHHAGSVAVMNAVNANLQTLQLADLLAIQQVYGANPMGGAMVSGSNLRGGNMDDTLIGTSGADSLVGSEGDDVLFGEDAGDTLKGGLGDDTLNGGAGNDSLIDGDGDDTLAGETGNDTLTGGIGADHLLGGDGLDQLDGGPGNDWLDGGAANDKLNGNAGADRLDGAAGNDALNGGPGADTLIGGGGNDTLTGADDDDDLSGGAGADSLYGLDGNDSLHGGTGIDTMKGGAGADLIDGGADDDRLIGEDGNDTLHGGAGDDRLDAGAGDDVLAGGPGTDLLWGNTGADRFDYDSLADSIAGTARDSIMDFNVAQGDTIDLTDIDADVGLAGDQAFSFVGSAATGAAGDLWLSGAILSGDVDGDGLADFQIRLAGAPVLDAGDFLL